MPKCLPFSNDAGIQPHVTLTHVDNPQVLEDEYGGWLSPKIVYGTHLLCLNWFLLEKIKQLSFFFFLYFWCLLLFRGDFVAYANVCFKEFGDRVSYWTTINEPNIFAIGGYDNGLMPPGRCSPPFAYPGRRCRPGNSTTEPYIAAHNMLLAHSSVVKLYRNKYKVLSIIP